MNINNFGLLNSVCSVINAAEDSSDQAIARYLVTHIPSLEELSVNAVIEGAFVTRSAVRRFCNRLGYSCWNDLKESFCDTAYPSDLSHRDMGVSLAGYKAELDKEIEKAFSDLALSTDMAGIDDLVRKIRSYERVEFMCANNVQGNLLRFQQEMFFAGKCITLLAWQGAEARSADSRKRLLIVVSVSGRYVDEAFDAIGAIDAYKILVTACRDERYRTLFDEIRYLGSESREIDLLGIYSKYAVTYFFDLVSAHYLNLYARRSTRE